MKYNLLGRRLFLNDNFVGMDLLRLQKATNPSINNGHREPCDNEDQQQEVDSACADHPRCVYLVLSDKESLMP